MLADPVQGHKYREYRSRTYHSCCRPRSFSALPYPHQLSSHLLVVLLCLFFAGSLASRMYAGSEEERYTSILAPSTSGGPLAVRSAGNSRLANLPPLESDLHPSNPCVHHHQPTRRKLVREQSESTCAAMTMDYENLLCGEISGFGGAFPGSKGRGRGSFSLESDLVFINQIVVET